ncbi:Serine/threonine-protein phosphatase [Giardia muris]|uniref:Serine/threonine-protein phosphatase n=1 Tax=Giardia muris TaxID=5742 RepID=A0A4Z1TCR4_GIAMU|nr:Serine/threonine-protein phosphatase [Giardia muris]|eukprot:TNJ30379.1 Serine/threonine-protein phosphatase [Giardia muris]
MDIDNILGRLKRCELPTELEAEELAYKAKELFQKEPNVLQVKSPVTIVGDIHGQFYDLRELFSIGGAIPDVHYLFMGDYVDRGYFSVETFMLLVAYKIKYPMRLSLLRGNHECRQITQTYGYNDECLRKYGSNRIWRLFCDVFDLLPISALVDDKVYCVHGGLSRHINAISDIAALSRIGEIPSDGPITDLLWSDPAEDANATGFSLSGRGAGSLFGGDVVESFIAANDLEFMARSHQLVMDGYQFKFNNLCLTLWSCPNYCYRSGNIAAILEFGYGSTYQFKIFEEAPASCRALPDRRCIPDYFL